jgi:hypothetical protein
MKLVTIRVLQRGCALGSLPDTEYGCTQRDRDRRDVLGSGATLDRQLAGSRGAEERDQDEMERTHGLSSERVVRQLDWHGALRAVAS